MLATIRFNSKKSRSSPKKNPRFNSSPLTPKLQSNPLMATSNKGKQRDLVESIYSCLTLFFIFLACVELCDAATVVDVYRLIQYDLAGVPLGSRFARLNHHAACSPFFPGTDLSRSVVIVPVRQINLTFISECITQKKVLGGLLLLLPQKLSSEKKDSEEAGSIAEKEAIRNTLAELEQLLIHANLPYPVYFAYEDEEIDAILNDFNRKDALGQSPTATTGGLVLHA